MRLSTSTAICGTAHWTKKMYFSCEQSMREIKRAGFDAVDICFDTYEKEPYPMTKPDWRDWAKRQKELADELNLPITQGHAHFYTINEARAFTEADRRAQFEIMKRDIEAAAICEIPWLVFHPETRYDCAGYSRTLTLREETERFRRLGDVAAHFGVGIAIENYGRNSKENRFFGSTAEDLLELLALLGDDALYGICWDTGHAHLHGLSQVESLKQIGHRLKALHINDNKGEKDEHQLPFLGKIAWEPIVQTLREIQYQGDFTYEVVYFTPGFPPELFHESLRFCCQVGRHLLL